MACIAGACPVCSLFNVVHRRIPVIGQSIKILHFYSVRLKCTSYSRYDPEGCQGLAVTRIQPQDKAGLGL